MHLAHDSLRNIQNDHSSKYQFVHHNLPLSQMHHGQILVDDVKTVTFGLSNVTFSLVMIRNQLGVHTMTKLFDRFPIHCIAEQLLYVFLKIRTCPLTFLGIEQNVRSKICLLIEASTLWIFSTFITSCIYS